MDHRLTLIHWQLWMNSNVGVVTKIIKSPNKRHNLEGQTALWCDATAEKTLIGVCLPGPKKIPGTDWPAAAAGSRWCLPACTRAQPSCLGSPGTTKLVPLGRKSYEYRTTTLLFKDENQLKPVWFDSQSIVTPSSRASSPSSQVWRRKSPPLPVCASKINYDKQHVH